MDKFYLPMETIRITQNYDGTTSHYNHSHGNIKDYPIDMAGADSGQSCIFASTELKVMAIKGIGNKNITNTIWLVSTNKVKATTFIDIAFMTITHFNDNAMKWKVGDIIPKGEIITWEGTDGADANHLHIVFGRGSSNSWTQNDKGSWVMVGDTKKPEEVCYIYDKFSTVVDTKDIVFEHTDTDTYEEKTVDSNGQSFFDENGWFGYGDNHENIGKIAEFMYKTFPAYTDKKALGCYYGKYIMASIKEFQKRTGLLQDGNVGPMTLSKLKEYGFEY